MGNILVNSITINIVIIGMAPVDICFNAGLFLRLPPPVLTLLQANTPVEMFGIDYGRMSRHLCTFVVNVWLRVVFRA